MSYKAGEAELLSLFRTLSEFDASNSISITNNNPPKGGYHWLDTGSARAYLFLSEGPFTSEQITMRRWHHSFTTFAEVLVRYTSPDGTETRTPEGIMTDLTDAIRSSLVTCTGLSSNAIIGSVMLSQGTAPRPITNSNKQVWLVQTLTIEWKQQENL